MGDAPLTAAAFELVLQAPPRQRIRGGFTLAHAGEGKHIGLDPGHIAVEFHMTAAQVMRQGTHERQTLQRSIDVLLRGPAVGAAMLFDGTLVVAASQELPVRAIDTAGIARKHLQDLLARQESSEFVGLFFALCSHDLFFSTVKNTGQLPRSCLS